MLSSQPLLGGSINVLAIQLNYNVNWFERNRNIKHEPYEASLEVEHDFPVYLPTYMYRYSWNEHHWGGVVSNVIFRERIL